MGGGGEVGGKGYTRSGKNACMTMKGKKKFAKKKKTREGKKQATKAFFLLFLPQKDPQSQDPNMVDDVLLQGT